MKKTASAAAAALLAAATLVGCGSGDDTGSATGDTTSAPGTVTSTADSDSASTSETSTTTTVNANTASVDEMAAAFGAAGVPSADRWAREVEEYRPYVDDDWAHLKQELSKYNIDDETLSKILSTLEL